MTTEQTAQQLELAAQILRTGHPFEACHDASDRWHASLGVNPAQAVLQNWCLRPVLATPPDGRPLHNPDNLTAEAVGVGYRLIVEGESPHEDADMWMLGSRRWAKCGTPEGSYGRGWTYRLPLSVPWPEPADPYADPQTKTVPLGPEDVRCGDEIMDEYQLRRCVFTVGTDGVSLGGEGFIAYKHLTGRKIRRRDSNEFVPCSKTIPA